MNNFLKYLTEMNMVMKEYNISAETYSDVHYRLYEATKDIEGYEKSMKTHQTIIKNWMETYNEQLIEAVTNICKQEDDARYQLKFLCAGYELASGVDYTCR